MRTLSLAILTIISVPVFAQLHFSKIDSLKTADEVETLIHTVYTNMDNSKLNTSLTFDRKECQRMADKLHPPPFFKTDFDNDGYTDLIVRLYTSYNGASDTSYETKVLSYTDSGWCIGTFMEGDLDNNWSFAFADSVEGQPCIYCCRPNYEDKMGKLKGMRVDTLVNKFGCYMNYNAKPKHAAIKRIDYKVGSVWDWDGHWIRINNLGQAAATKATAGHPADFHLIDTAAYKRLIEMIDYANLPALKNSYSTSHIFDAGTVTLTVAYANGRTKVISDYAAQGPASLEAINSLIAEIYYNDLKK